MIIVDISGDTQDFSAKNYFSQKHPINCKELIFRFAA